MTKQKMLDEEINFSFSDTKNDSDLQSSVTEQTKNNEDESISSNDCSSSSDEIEDCDTESDYQFSLADEEETKKVNKLMAFSMIDLLRARESNGFTVNKITKQDFNTDFVYFQFVTDTEEENEQGNEPDSNIELFNNSINLNDI